MNKIELTNKLISALKEEINSEYFTSLCDLKEILETSFKSINPAAEIQIYHSGLGSIKFNIGLKNKPWKMNLCTIIKDSHKDKEYRIYGDYINGKNSNSIENIVEHLITELISNPNAVYLTETIRVASYYL